MKNEELIDILNILSFVIGLMNYQENLTQNDKQEILDEFNSQLHNIINQIEQHLASQDNRLDQIEQHLSIQDQKLNQILEKLNN